MATGFEKFREKTLNESPISINTPQTGNDMTQQRTTVHVTRAGKGVGESAGRLRSEELKSGSGVGREIEPEKLFQITIKIRPSTKEKLDWLKYSQKKKFMELAEEAFEDIYNKYSK